MHTKFANKKVALVHDWFISYRGGEKVFEAIAELFPEADVYCLFKSKNFKAASLENRKVEASFLNRWPWVSHYYRYLLPLYPSAIETLDLTAYDVVVSSSHAAAKGVITGVQTTHVSYCHTPMRYLWDKSFEYFKGSKRLLYSCFLKQLRIWDAISAQRVDFFIANSNFTKKRIEKFYRRDARVVYPFVDDRWLKRPLNESAGKYYLVVSGLVPYKNIELAIRACESLGKSLKIVGSGPEEKKLRALSKNNTEFLGYVANDDLIPLYENARALLFPGEEDFGIVPLEAMAMGKPVIALGKGGALETVIPEQTGVLFPAPTVESLKQAIQNFEKLTFSASVCREQAAKFSKEKFQKELLESIASFL